MLADIADSIEIHADRGRVWAVLTTPGLVEEWLGCLHYTGQVGSTFYMQPDPGRRAAGSIEGATHCELEALDEGEAMRFSWFMPGTPKTHVAIALSDAGSGRTLVRLTHSGWGQFDAEAIRGIRDALAGGWSSHVLPNLKRVSERQSGPGAGA